jgi:hypothetical protein
MKTLLGVLFIAAGIGAVVYAFANVDRMAEVPGGANTIGGAAMAFVVLVPTGLAFFLRSAVLRAHAPEWDRPASPGPAVDGLIPGMRYRVAHLIDAFSGNAFRSGDEVRFVRRDYRPSVGGYTYVFETGSMYLHEDADAEAIAALSTYLQPVST